MGGQSQAVIPARPARATCRATSAARPRWPVGGEQRYQENTRYSGTNREEEDFADLHVTRLVAELAGLIRKCKGRFNGGRVSVLVPDASLTERKARAIIASLGLRGFSREALWAWHRMAPKMDANKLTDQFVTAGINLPECRHHLGGMLVSVTGHVT